MKPERIHLSGVITPQILQQLSENQLSSWHDRIHRCQILEIRYDLFENHDLWPLLSQQIKRIHPEAIQIGTIRLQEDGGFWPNQIAADRKKEWEKILKSNDYPEWIDVEIHHYNESQPLIDLAKKQGVKLLASAHDFRGIPNDQWMEKSLQMARYFAADGFKLAAMSQQVGDCKSLYQWAIKETDHWDLLALFAMGITGRSSRIWSLKKGCNLTYGALGDVKVPGLIAVDFMADLIDQLQFFKREEEITAWLTEKNNGE